MSHSPTAYYLPPPSHWPIVGSGALLGLASGFILLLAKIAAGPWVMALGAALLVWMLVGWFGSVIRENQAGLLEGRVDVSFRWGMVWFIFSEVMFFAGFFGALFYARNIAVPWLAEAQLLWPGYAGAWPTAGPALTEMARWKHLPHALPAFILLGRMAGRSESEIQAAWAKGEREIVLKPGKK